MQLTHFTDIALRVLMYLSNQERVALVQIAEIAEQFGVPRNHLTKVVNRLAALGWVDTTRGRHGGLRLGVAAESLRLGTVLQKVEGCSQLIDCDKVTCGLRGACLLKGALDEGLQLFYDKMNEYTLADIMKSPTKEKIARLHLIRTASEA